MNLSLVASALHDRAERFDGQFGWTKQLLINSSRSANLDRAGQNLPALLLGLHRQQCSHPPSTAYPLASVFLSQAAVGLRRCLVTLSGYTLSMRTQLDSCGGSMRDPLSGPSVPPITGRLGELGTPYATRAVAVCMAFLWKLTGTYVCSPLAVAELHLKFRATESYVAANEGSYRSQRAIHVDRP